MKSMILSIVAMVFLILLAQGMAAGVAWFVQDYYYVTGTIDGVMVKIPASHLTFIIMTVVNTLGFQRWYRIMFPDGNTQSPTFNVTVNKPESSELKSYRRFGFGNLDSQC